MSKNKNRGGQRQGQFSGGSQHGPRQDERPREGYDPQTAISDLPGILGNDTDALVNHADKLGRYLKDISKSSIRNIYNEVKKVEMGGFEQNKPRLKLIIPRAEYTMAKIDKREAPIFAKLIREAINRVGNDENRFELFVAFFESILAYHKVHGGK